MRAISGSAEWKPIRKKRSDSYEERRAVEDAVLAEVAEVCRAYGARVVTDQFSAPTIVDRLRRAGLSVKTVPMTATSKTAAFSELRARLYAGELELYEEPTLLAELRRLRTRYTAGHAAVVNPQAGDSHGDVAQAVALAVWAHSRWRAQADGPRAESEPAFLPRSRAERYGHGRRESESAWLEREFEEAEGYWRPRMSL